MHSMINGFDSLKHYNEFVIVIKIKDQPLFNEQICTKTFQRKVEAKNTIIKKYIKKRKKVHSQVFSLQNKLQQSFSPLRHGNDGMLSECEYSLECVHASPLPTPYGYKT